MIASLHALWFCHQPFFIPDDEITWRVDATYIPLVDAFVEREVPMTLGMTGGLLERVARLRPDFIGWIRLLLREEKITLVGTAAYHPLLPSLDRRWGLAHLSEDIRVRGELDLPALRVLWPTELAWSMQVGALAIESGYEAVVVDGYCRDFVDAMPTWRIGNTGLRRDALQQKEVNRPARLLLEFDGTPLQLWVRERDLSEALVEVLRGEEEDHRHHLVTFLEALSTTSQRSLMSTGPMLLAEDAERILPDGLARLLDLLDGLLNVGVRFCTAECFRATSSSRAVGYVPAGTMQGGLELWDGTLDDRWLRARIERLSDRAARQINPLNPHERSARERRDQILRLQDSGLYFWPFVSRTRRPFVDGLHALEVWLDSERPDSHE